MSDIYPVIGRRSLYVVLQVQGIHVKCVDHISGIFQPHCRAIEIHQHPLVRVKIEGICQFDSFHQISEFRAYEGGAWRGKYLQKVKKK